MRIVTLLTKLTPGRSEPRFIRKSGHDSEIALFQNYGIMSCDQHDLSGRAIVIWLATLEKRELHKIINDLNRDIRHPKKSRTRESRRLGQIWKPSSWQAQKTQRPTGLTVAFSQDAGLTEFLVSDTRIQSLLKLSNSNWVAQTLCQNQHRASVLSQSPDNVARTVF